MIAYPERSCFRLGPAQGIPRQNFREIWVEIGEIFKQNLGDSGAKLWSGATPDVTVLGFVLDYPIQNRKMVGLTLKI